MMKKEEEEVTYLYSRGANSIYVSLNGGDQVIEPTECV